MDHKITDKPWDHPERDDWCQVLAFMVTEIRAGKTQAQVVEETSKYINDNGLSYTRSNISTYYPWLLREVKKEDQQ